jgi:hypothetical protein
MMLRDQCINGLVDAASAGRTFEASKQECDAKKRVDVWAGGRSSWAASWQKIGEISG